MRPRFRSAFMVPSGFCVVTPAVESPRAKANAPRQGRATGGTETHETSAPQAKGRAQAA